MPNLFWKTKEGTKSLLATPFKTEEEFEKIVFSTPEILEDIYLIKRQVRGGSKKGIPDIVGIDTDGNICIVEMKNMTVDASIISQVMEYAIWAETNPDSIRSLWLEHPNKPDDLEISWDDFQVRIIIIAPSILPSTLKIVKRINYPVDLIEINRWVEKDNQLLFVKKLEIQESANTIRPVSGLRNYDDEFYKHAYNSESAKHFLEYVKSVEKIIQENGWNLTTKFNKHYCGFKAGYLNAFGIKWVGSKTFAFFLKLSEPEAKKIKIPMTKYDKQWKEANYYIDPNKTKVEDYIPLFELAYKRLTGE